MTDNGGLNEAPSIASGPAKERGVEKFRLLTHQKVSESHNSVFVGDGPDFMYGGINFGLWLKYYQMVPYLLRLPLSAVGTFAFNTFYKGWASPNIHISELLNQPSFPWIFHKKFKSYELERLVRQKVDTNNFWIHNYLNNGVHLPVYEKLRLGFFMAFGTHGVLYKGTDAHDALLLDFISPYYDPELFDFVQFLPSEFKFRKGKGKYLHKQVLFRYIPRKIMERPKHGFIINYSEFGLESLRSLTDTYLNKKRLKAADLYDAEYAVQVVDRYYNGDKRMGPLLWTLLVFEIWRDQFSL